MAMLSLQQELGAANEGPHAAALQAEPGLAWTPPVARHASAHPFVTPVTSHHAVAAATAAAGAPLLEACSPAAAAVPPSGRFATGDLHATASLLALELPGAAPAPQQAAVGPHASSAVAPLTAVRFESQAATSPPAAASPLRSPTGSANTPESPSSAAAAATNSSASAAATGSSPPAAATDNSAPAALPDLRKVQLADARAEAAAARAEAHRAQLEVATLEDRAAELQRRLEDAGSADAGALQDELSQMRMSNAMLQASLECQKHRCPFKCFDETRAEVTLQDELSQTRMATLGCRQADGSPCSSMRSPHVLVATLKCACCIMPHVTVSVC